VINPGGFSFQSKNRGAAWGRWADDEAVLGFVWMRHSFLVTCLLLTAWTEPAGNVTQPMPLVAVAGNSVMDKTTEGRATGNDEIASPAETTKQLIEFDDVAVSAPQSEPKATTTYISGDALAALEAVADGLILVPQQRVPLPPHRAIPHAQVCEALASAASNNDLPTPFLIRLIWQESGFRQDVISAAGAQGVAQFMPTTAAEHGLDDPFNPLQAVRASARLLRELIQQFGNVGLAAAAYNAGPRRVQEWLDKRGKLPQETQDYVQRITGKKAEEWKIKTASAAPLRVPARAPCQREAGLYAANGPEQIPLPPILAKPEPVKLADAKSKTDVKNTKTETSDTTKTASAKAVDKSAAKSAATTTGGKVTAAIKTTKGGAKIIETVGQTESATGKKPVKSAAKTEPKATARHTQSKAEAKVAAKAETKPEAATPTTATKGPLKLRPKTAGKKVKVADAEARK
jgi:hypothetical protein